MNWMVTAKVLTAIGVTIQIAVLISILVAPIISRKYLSADERKTFEHKIPYRKVDYVYDAVWLSLIPFGIWFIFS